MSAIGRFCCGSRRVLDRGGCRDFVKRLQLSAHWSGGIDRLALTLGNGYAKHAAVVGGGRATSLASRRRFCAIAASVNSSCAPDGPRNRSRPSFKIRLRWANSISTRLRLRRDFSNASVVASAHATSRASSWMLRGILRSGAFGQHLGLNGQGPQSEVLAR